MSNSLEELKNEFINQASNNIDKCPECGFHSISKLEDAWDAAIKAVSEREKKLVESCEKSLFALQCMIIKFNGEVPGLTGQQVFDGAIQARENLKETLKQISEILEVKS